MQLMLGARGALHSPNISIFVCNISKMLAPNKLLFASQSVLLLNQTTDDFIFAAGLIYSIKKSKRSIKHKSCKTNFSSPEFIFGESTRSEQRLLYIRFSHDTSWLNVSQSIDSSVCKLMPGKRPDLALYTLEVIRTQLATRPRGRGGQQETTSEEKETLLCPQVRKNTQMP